MAVCFLHAGIEKTGSTALQQFLLLNEAALARRGIWLPRALLDAEVSGVAGFNHVLLSTASHLSSGAPDDLQRRRGLASMAQVAAHRQEIIRALAAEHAGLGFAPSAIIVSNEHVHSRLGLVEDLVRARDLLAPYAARIRVVVYLRRQDEVARSLAAMHIRHGATQARLIPDFSPSHGFDEVLGVNADYFDYARLLERLVQAFGGDALEVRRYQGRGFDIIEDFFGALGMPIAELQRPARQNTSLDQEAADLLLKLNQMVQIKPQLGAVRAHVLSHLIGHHAGELRPAPYEEVVRFLLRFEASNEAVRRRWFPDCAELFSPVEMRDDPVAEMTEARALEMLKGILEP